MSDFQFTPAEQKRIDGCIEECVQSLQRVESEKFFRKDAFDSLKEDVPITKELFNALVNERFDEKSSKAIEKHSDVVQLNEILRNNASREEAEE